MSGLENYRMIFFTHRSVSLERWGAHYFMLSKFGWLCQIKYITILWEKLWKMHSLGWLFHSPKWSVKAITLVCTLSHFFHRYEIYCWTSRSFDSKTGYLHRRDITTVSVLVSLNVFARFSVVNPWQVSWFLMSLCLRQTYGKFWYNRFRPLTMSIR